MRLNCWAKTVGASKVLLVLEWFFRKSGIFELKVRITGLELKNKAVLLQTRLPAIIRLFSVLLQTVETAHMERLPTVASTPSSSFCSIACEVLCVAGNFLNAVFKFMTLALNANARMENHIGWPYPLTEVNCLHASWGKKMEGTHADHRIVSPGGTEHKTITVTHIWLMTPSPMIHL